MTVLVNSSSCSDSSSHSSVPKTLPISLSLRGGSVGGMPVSHPTANTSGPEVGTVNRTLEVSDPDSVFLNLPSSDCIVMGVTEQGVSAAEEATTRGNEDGGSVR